MQESAIQREPLRRVCRANPLGSAIEELLSSLLDKMASGVGKGHLENNGLGTIRALPTELPPGQIIGRAGLEPAATRL